MAYREYCKVYKNWYFESPFKIKFAMLESPNSIEFQNLKEREIYVSYPVGTLIPIYLICKIFNKAPSPSIVMRYNLLNHFLIAFILSVTIFVFQLMLKIDQKIALIISFIPASLMILLPGPLYFFQNVYFSDMAVILPLVIFLALEVSLWLPLKGNWEKKIRLTQRVVGFFGVFTDWLFLFFLVVVYVKRIFLKEISFVNFKSFFVGTVRFWLPTFLAVALFLIQIVSLDQIQPMVEKAIMRAGIEHEQTLKCDPSQNKYDNGYINQYLVQHYGDFAPDVAWGALELFLVLLVLIPVVNLFVKMKITREIKQTMAFIAMILLTCFVQYYGLVCHSNAHHFSVLKFSMIYAAVGFVLIPLLVILLLSQYLKKPIHTYIGIYLFVALACGGFFLGSNHKKMGDIFPAANPNLKKLGEFINHNTKYEDVVISPDLNLYSNPPQIISYTMKRVYQYSNLHDMKPWLSHMPPGFRVKVFIYKNEHILNNPHYQQLSSIATGRVENDVYILFEVPYEKI
jgi:hypothetical protein